ncbi:hypothetical protein [Arenibacter algicola]|uniref:Uncharacterized protein n=1 Tax=Arenibacter algicola TaxID=616991 RepID=A0A221US54_9FLAO|nr:hypothetical protein [Arenibacter algicola]ASO04083.1 hypothetical protein AREALGSMS7_00595 [Arenibacter algicola]
MEFLWSGLRSRFRIGNGEFLPRPDSYRDGEGLTEWKAEIGDGVQDFLVKLFARNAAFREIKWNVLNGL